MKLLFDQNLSWKLCARLADLFPGSVQVRELGLGRADDGTIWTYAKDGHFVIVTQDADFSTLSDRLGAPPKVIWLKTGNQKTAQIERVLRERFKAIEAFADDAACGYLDLG